MKAFSILAASLLAATAAMAGGGGGGTDTGTQACVTCPEININAPLLQSTSATDSTVKNTGSDGATAKQNLASNAGNVNINAWTTQGVTLQSASIENEASGNANSVATQNLATNIGKVNVNGRLEQYAAFARGGAYNVARSGATSTQNISSNNGCTVCNK